MFDVRIQKRDTLQRYNTTIKMFIKLIFYSNFTLSKYKISIFQNRSAKFLLSHHKE